MRSNLRSKFGPKFIGLIETYLEFELELKLGVEFELQSHLSSDSISKLQRTAIEFELS